jgi:hypothetical protein
MFRNRFPKRLVLAGAATCCLSLCGWANTPVQAQHACCGPSGHGGSSPPGGGDAHRGHSPVTTGQPSILDQPPHGGQVTAKLPYFFEVVYQPQATHVYLYGALQEPIPAQLVRGEVVMQVSYAPQVFRFPLTGVTPTSSSREQNHLVATVDVSQVPDGQMTVTFNLDNLPHRQQPQATFRQTFALTRAAVPVVVAPLLDADRAGVDRQQVCPVTGARLGSMGAPIKVVVDGQPLYLCCRGCVPRVVENPHAAANR